MTRALLLLVALTAPRFADAAEPIAVGRKLARSLEGDWVDGEGVAFRIVRTGKRVSIEDLVDYDGERFVVLSHRFDAGRFGWTYRVPSTDHEVAIEVESIARDALTTRWENRLNRGTETVRRADPR